MAPKRHKADEISLSNQLQRVLQGRVCILGVGNRYRRDDGAGSLMCERLDGRVSAAVIDAGTVPENYLERIARLRPDTILIIDAVDFASAPGDLRILEPEVVRSFALSTHALSLHMAADYLKARTRARVTFLAIQTGDIGSGNGLSEEVSRAVALLEGTLLAALGCCAVAGDS